MNDDKLENLLQKNVDRRKFMGGMAAAAGAVVAGTVLTQPAVAQAASPSVTWDGEADVVVLGFGAAGGAAACSAIATGASVLVLESTSVPGGTTRTSGGGAWLPNNSFAKANLPGFTDSEEEARTYLIKSADGQADLELIDSFIKTAPEVATFLNKEVGNEWNPAGPPDYHPEWPGGRRQGRSLMTVGGGQKLMTNLFNYAVAKGVKFAFNTHAKGLIQDVDDRVIGVEAIQDGAKLRIRAKKGVIICTGGFEWDETLRKNYQRGPGFAHATFTTGMGEGDGLKMAQGVGADLRNMNKAWGLVAYLLPGWEEEVAAYRQNAKNYKTGSWKKIVTDWVQWRGKPGKIIVNKDGERFCNEAGDYDTMRDGFFARDTFGECSWHNVPAYMISDSASMEKYGMAGTYGPLTAEGLAKLPDHIVKADTLEELAEKLNINPEGLKATVESFNQYASGDNPTDPVFHRGECYVDRSFIGDAAICAKDPEDLKATLGPLTKGPFYGVQVHPVTSGTCGGPRCNQDGQVYHVTGNLIKGLYAAGNAAGIGGPGARYAGGGDTIGPALVFGYLAGRHAAKN